jgi:hypothetical protein
MAGIESEAVGRIDAALERIDAALLVQPLLSMALSFDS